jgi:hypothetical protein
MKINRKRASKFVCLFMCVAACVFGPLLSVAAGQEADKPLTKEDLIFSFTPGQKEGIGVESYIDLIERVGVDFLLTVKDEKKFRSAGAYLGKGIEDLIAAIRNNYRPEPVEPTEAEMKAALIRTMQKRGGKLKPDGCVGVDNLIAGMCGKITDFEKLEGCKPATQGAGYTCTYNVTISLTAYSNEGTPDGDNHGRAIDSFIGLLGGKSVNETQTSRFVRSKEGWIMSN